MLALHITDAEKAFFSEETGIDWNVIFLLLGMMVIVSVLRRTGVFEYIAIVAAKSSRGRPYRLMVMLCLLTAVASAVLDNVTTVLLIAPVTFLVCDRLGLKAAPFLIAEVLASNIGGAATLVGDPPNIIIASRADLSFNDFLINMGPIVVVLLAVFCVMIRWLFRKAFVFDAEKAEAVMLLNEREAITDKPLLIKSLAVLGLVVVAFVAHPVLHYEPSIVALLGAGLLFTITKVTVQDAIADVEWPTLVFFGGLFIMVGSLVETGVIGKISTYMADKTEGDLGLAAMILLGGSAVLSAIVDNIPYVATMSPVVADLVRNCRRRRHGALVVAGPRRRPRRQRDRDRRVGQRRHARTGREGRTQDRLLGVHQVRPRGHRGDDLPVRALYLLPLPVRPVRRDPAN